MCLSYLGLRGDAGADGRGRRLVRRPRTLASGESVVELRRGDGDDQVVGLVVEHREPQAVGPEERDPRGQTCATAALPHMESDGPVGEDPVHSEVNPHPVYPCIPVHGTVSMVRPVAVSALQQDAGPLIGISSNAQVGHTGGRRRLGKGPSKFGELHDEPSQNVTGPHIYFDPALRVRIRAPVVESTTVALVIGILSH